MQYVRNLSDSVSTAWNSINPATLSGAIDVIVIEHDDGTLACSPFHVRFGKFSLLRPYEKKVEFKVNGVKQDYSMKLGEGGEASFVFETTDRIPQSMQTSPIVSPAASPTASPTASPPLSPTPAHELGEPELLELEKHRETQEIEEGESVKPQRPPNAVLHPQPRPTDTSLTPAASDSEVQLPQRPKSGDWSGRFTPHSYKDDAASAREEEADEEAVAQERSQSPPTLPPKEAVERARALSKGLSAANIPNKVTESGDLMLDMSVFKNNEEDMFRAEILARKVLSEALEGNYDIGALIGLDEGGNLWIYSSEEAKEDAMKRTVRASMRPDIVIAADAASDPGYQSDGSDITTREAPPLHRRSESDVGHMDITPPSTPPSSAAAGEKTYAKTLRLTSAQLKALNLNSGQNSMSFTVNRATCHANMYLWKHETPVVISDIDGTITKSDALGHVLNMLGRDWTHLGVAKLYSDIVANGYNIMYLTSRSVGQADTTRTYLSNIVQDGYKLPRGPTILSPDRTMAALRREIYLRQPQVFKMATLRDIRSLYGPDRKPFYAGFGNRLTDQLSYRTVDVPRNRIFTINSDAEVSLDLMSLNKYKTTYVNINEVVDHFFPPVTTLITGGGEDFTDFKYWRQPVLELDEFTASESDENEKVEEEDQESQYEYEAGDGMMDSYISRDSMGEASNFSEGEEQEDLTASMMEEEEDADDEEEEEMSGDETEDLVTAGDVHDEAAKPVTTKNTHLVEDYDAEAITGLDDEAKQPNQTLPVRDGAEA